MMHRVHTRKLRLFGESVGLTGLLFCMLAALGMSFSSCGGGINPSDYSQTASFSGTINFVRGSGAANYPSRDSIYDLRVVAFHNQPVDTNLIQEIALGQAIFSSESLLDTNAFPATRSYSMDIQQNQLASGVVTFRYIVVAQRYGPNISSDWKVAGIYSADSIYSPKVLILSNGTNYKGVDIDVDFLRPPPQPFKR